MQFLDLNTGYTFDALWTENQSNGYTFWFPNEQSINLTYTMPICMYIDSPTAIKLEIEENQVFSFITHSTEQTDYDGFRFNEPIYTYTTYTSVEEINGKYFHKFYLAGKSETAGEFTAFIDIKDYGRIKIGADFYGEYEPTYINLSNMGVEIPDYIQKAIYDSNVHEDYKDNILINRKLKELLSNYWDLMANRGSYKSLLNTLSWFEWGDILRIREIWKRDNAGKTIYDDRELCSLLEDKYKDSMGNFIKTVYISLYVNLYRDTEVYDSENNPELEAIALKWGKEDLALKISLLSQFFSTFFMPIHMSIFHACVENVVYTNTIKQFIGNTVNRVDAIEDFNYISSNIKDDSIFKLSNVRTQVSENTVFKTDYKQTDVTVGVDSFPSNGKVDNNSIYNFAAQYYAGPGAIIPVELTIHGQANKDYIKYTSIDFIPDGKKECQKFIFNDRIDAKENKITVKFNLLVKEAREYVLNFMFITASCKTFTKQITIKVQDTDNLNIQLYKVQAKDDSKGFTYKDWKDKKYNDYFCRIQPNIEGDKKYYSQYLPFMHIDNELYPTYKGIKLTRTVVIDMLNKNGKGKVYDEIDIAKLRGFMDNDFLEFDKRELILDEDGNLQYDEDGKLLYGPIMYTIWVSKKFNAEVPQIIFDEQYNIIRNSLGFYPQFHNLVPLNSNNIDDYTVNQYEALCCAVEINNGNNTIPFRYGHLIEDAEWTFKNSTTLENFNHTASVRQPFIASNKYEVLPDGYYDVIFRYKLTDTKTKELHINSAFRKKSI